MKLTSLAHPTLSTPSAVRTAAPRVASPFEAAGPVDKVSSDEPAPLDPRSMSCDKAAEAEPASQGRLMRGLALGFLVATSMLGLAGCADPAAESAYTLAQNMTGKMAQQGYSSISYLNQQAAKGGGGLYSEKDPTAESKLTSIKALDRMLDNKPIYFQGKADSKVVAVRSWDELRGLAENIKDGVHVDVATPARPAAPVADSTSYSGG